MTAVGAISPTKLRVIVVEDRPSDAGLMMAELRRSGFEVDWVRVETEDAFVEALKEPPDIVLADYSLPRFSAIRALGLLLEHAPDVPLIVVTGQLGDEAAAECMKLGACDYVLKDRLARLGPAVEIALQQRRLDEERRAALAALEESEQRLKLVLEASRNAFWDVDLVTCQVERSPQVALMLGYAPEDMDWINQHWEELIHPEDLPAVKTAFAAHLAGEEEVYDTEYRLRRKNGSYIWVAEHGRVVRHDREGRPVRAAGTLRDVTEAKSMRERLSESLEELRALAQRLQTVREEERAGLAREVHDVLGQEMTGLKMDVRWLARKMEAVKSPDDLAELKDKLASMSSQLDQTMQTIRRISTALRPPVLDALGLVAALEWQAGDFEKWAGIPCRFHSSEEDIALDEGRSTAVFRIFQEALTNVARHARATRVDAQLTVRDGVLTLIVRDNGVGMVQQRSTASRSLGLLGMQERAMMFGGTVDVTGEPGRGTCVTLTMPIGRGA